MYLKKDTKEDSEPEAKAEENKFKKSRGRPKKKQDQKDGERRAFEVPPFIPPTLEEIQNALKVFGIPEQYAESSPILKAKRGTLVLSKFKTKDVRGDGNCGYRALSYLLTGSQDFHWQIRMRVMEYVVQNHKMFWMEGADGYPAYVSSYNTLVKYPKARGVQRKHWASDNDFLGFARLANINVYLYNPPDRKYNYSRCVPLIKEGKWDKEDGAFFVEWVNENHFIPIVGV